MVRFLNPKKSIFKSDKTSVTSCGGKNTKTEIDEFDRAISVLKLQEGDIDRPSGDKKIEKFKTFFKEYQAKLREANLIDYDDILIMSVKLLENNPDILEYYQNICEYIIAVSYTHLTLPTIA